MENIICCDSTGLEALNRKLNYVWVARASLKRICTRKILRDFFSKASRNFVIFVQLFNAWSEQLFLRRSRLQKILFNLINLEAL